MTFTPCGECPGPGTCSELEARTRAVRGACDAFLHEENPCAAEIRPASFVDQPEFCDEYAVEGSEFCAYHRDALA